MNSRFYKDEADRLLAVNDRKNEFVKITLVLMLINVVISTVIPPLASFVVLPIVSLIFARTAHKVYCNKDISLNGIFSDFSKILDVILYNLITIALTMLGMILFIIPGIIIGLSLSMGYFIMADEPEISFSDALKKSREMMKGHLWEFFKLQFSFFGWYILIALTLGILSLWVTPRIETANMVFYARLKKELYGEDVGSVADESAPFEPYAQTAYRPEADTAPNTYYAQPEAAEPVVETAPAVEEEPVVEAAPIVEEAPVVEAEAVVEAAPVAEEVSAEEFTAPEYIVPASEPATDSDNGNTNSNNFKF